ncbi:MAG: hypothetical protein KDF65_05095, partial [Anaerolineae bacterium]|nr:hypothetical protein [Anaerolineae bacterium]
CYSPLFFYCPSDYSPTLPKNFAGFFLIPLSQLWERGYSGCGSARQASADNFDKPAPRHPEQNIAQDQALIYIPDIKF